MTYSSTGVGSLPHADPDEAAAFVLHTVEIPYLPQLPMRHPEEGVLAQWGDGLCGCGAGGFGLEFGAAPGPAEEAFIGAAGVVDALPTDTPQVKVQATGPVTLVAAMIAGGHPGTDLWQCVQTGLADRVERHVGWVRDRLPAAEITLIFDEPALAALGGWADVPSGEAFSRLGQSLATAPVPTGVHCCGETDWAALGRLRPAVISVDVAALGPRFGEAADELAAAITGGTRMIWGAVPVETPPLPEVEELVAKIRRAEGTLVVAGADMRRLGDAWVSPACGMVGVTIEQAAAISGRVADVAVALRD